MLSASNFGRSSPSPALIPHLWHPHRLHVQKTGGQLRARRPQIRIHRGQKNPLRKGSSGRPPLDNHIIVMTSVVVKVNGLCSICLMIMVSKVVPHLSSYLDLWLSAFANVLRILHRYAPHPISSSFLPSSALGDCCASQVKPFLRESSSAVIPYPEWRVNIVDTAQKVGMGDVGKPMAWVLWPEMGLGGGSFVPNIRKRQQESSQRTSYPPSPISSCSSSDPEFDEYSDDDSELEWDGWTKDLDRQSLVRQHTAGFSKKSYTQSSISSLSSSLPPDHSSGNQSGRVHQVPPTSLNENSSRWNPAQPFSSNELYKTQSSEILSRNSADMARTPEVVIATGINLDSPSSSRRRSATVGPGMLARLAKDVEKISIGQPSATSATSGTPPNLLTVHDVPPFKNPPLRNVRYTQSNSNLFSRPSSEDFANCQREGVLLPLPTVESKHQGSFIRGATKRAERLVRGF